MFEFGDCDVVYGVCLFECGGVLGNDVCRGVFERRARAKFSRMNVCVKIVNYVCVYLLIICIFWFCLLWWWIWDCWVRSVWDIDWRVFCECSCDRRCVRTTLSRA